MIFPHDLTRIGNNWYGGEMARVLDQVAQELRLAGNTETNRLAILMALTISQQTEIQIETICDEEKGRLRMLALLPLEITGYKAKAAQPISTPRTWAKCTFALVNKSKARAALVNKVEARDEANARADDTDQFGNRSAETWSEGAKRSAGIKKREALPSAYENGSATITARNRMNRTREDNLIDCRGRKPARATPNYDLNERYGSFIPRERKGICLWDRAEEKRCRCIGAKLILEPVV